jgi:hypothetical protein
MSRRKQIRHNGNAGIRHRLSVEFAMSAAQDENGPTASPACGLDIRDMVSDKVRALQLRVVLVGRGDDETRFRLATPTTFVRTVWAGVYCRKLPTVFPNNVGHPLVELPELSCRDLASIDNGLIGHHHDPPP